MSALLDIRGLKKRFGAIHATDGLSLDVQPGEIHALIGPNGAGKSSLIAQISGVIRPDAGSILFEGQDITDWTPARRARAGLARSYQITSVYPNASLLDQVLLAAEALDGHPFHFWRPSRAQTHLLDCACTALDAVGLMARAEDRAQDLSHGEQRQLEIALALASAPKMLLLDEPAAGMSAEETKRLDVLLTNLRGRMGMLLIEHDVDLVFALADRITVLHEGRAIASGAPDIIRRDAAVRSAYLGDAA